MILFFWSGGLGGGRNNAGAVMGVVSFVFMLLIPSLINILYLGDEILDEQTEQSLDDTDINTQSSLPFYTLLLLQVVIPMAVVGVLVTALTDERVRRYFRLGTLDDTNDAHGTRNMNRQQTRRREQAAAIAARIRKLPLIEFRSRKDLERMSLKELVAYRNEARDKRYKAITTSSGRKQSDLLQSKEDVINDIVGRAASEDGEDEDLCSICYAQYQSNDVLRVLPKCGHVFHAECGDLWFVRNQTCPLCKSEL
jgi:hypothetical protein